MTNKPVVFISCTSDLRSARDLVGKVLYSMGYEPVWQDIEPTDGGELLGVLRKRIRPCSFVIQFVGQRYGAEPPTPTSEFGRVSYTQYEALFAEKLGKKVIYYFVGPEFPRDRVPEESPTCRSSQYLYRRRIEETNKLRHTGLTSAQDLELSVRRIRDELAAAREQSDRRFRKMLVLIGLALAGIVIVVALSLKILNRLEIRAAQQREQMASLRAELLAAISSRIRPSLAGQAAPAPLPPTLIEKANMLLKNGDTEDRAVANIALGHHEEADRLIQDVKQNSDVSSNDAFRLAMLEGDNWLQADPQKAIDAYERAFALRPNDVKVRLALAPNLALSDPNENGQRAVEIAEGTLKLVAPGTKEWALAQWTLGLAYQLVPGGDRTVSLRKAVAAYEASLTIFTRQADPDPWDFAQENLALDCQQLGQVLNESDSGAYVAKAIATHQLLLNAAITDTDRATAQKGLAEDWFLMPTGDRDANLRKAISACDAALSFYARQAHDYNWAVTQNVLGDCWRELTTGDPGQNLSNAIAAYKQALTILTKDETDEWCRAQTGLAEALRMLPTGDKRENLRGAIATYEAIILATDDNAAGQVAAAFADLGRVLAELAEIKGENRLMLLRRAIACEKAALLSSTPESTEARAVIKDRLATHRRAYEAAGGSAFVPFDQISAKNDAFPPNQFDFVQRQ